MRLPKAVFWDMDGTLIDSEPYWHASEMELAEQYSGQWSEDIGWQFSGKPVIDVAAAMHERGVDLPLEEIKALIEDGVARREQEQVPWVPGALDLLQALKEEGVPSVLVTSSPRRIAQAVVNQAPSGAFEAFTCGDDGLPMKPDPAPYLYAGELVGLGRQEMPTAIAIDDTLTGLRSAADSGATTLAFTGANPNDTSQGPQFASCAAFAQLSPEILGQYVSDRMAQL